MSEIVWGVRPADAGEVAAIRDATGVPLAVARVLWLRGYRTPAVAQAFLAAREGLGWLTPLETPGMKRAVARIRQAVDRQEPFVIYGDYDCDGVTSTALLYRYLARGLGARCTAYLPDRFKDGYGVTAAAIERIAAQGIKLVLTCDNGISATSAAEAARRLGVEIVVTDHHQPPEVLPDVAAIVHPALEFPHLRDVAGVGVALLFVVALEGGFTPRLAHFLDLACIGTIGDVVPLDGPNRSLVWAGLERFRQSRHRFPGLGALATVAKTPMASVRAEDVAFQLVPRLNAAGRLETPDVGFQLLTTNDREEAAAHAERLDVINRERRELSAELQAAIFAELDASWDLEAEPFIVLADSRYHHGITGIIAGRIKDRYRVPVMLFSGHGDGPWKGSGRSPEGLHLYEALHGAREHLMGFGGHAQAAGCATLAASLPAVRQSLNDHVRAVGWQRPPDAVTLDAELTFLEADATLLDALDLLEPFGQRNPAPVFGLLKARVISQRVVKNHLFLQVDDGESVREVIAWGKAERAADLRGWIRLTYRPRLNTWQGETRVQLVADRLEPTASPAPAVVRLQAEEEPGG
ncbi:MAG: single-stranded-DNA-specific exonuclease RecJ [Candidatus Sericytochromatia bacterium]|nr:single-stranded-DNA-specific exonuclease RecJ [Candidatus Sericytochromatia bacterium]